MQTVIGHESQYFVPNHWAQFYPPYSGHYETGIIFDITSDWSNTQTFTIGDDQTPTPSPATTPTPTNYTVAQLTEQEIIIGAFIVAAIVGAGLGLLIYLIKRK